MYIYLNASEIAGLINKNKYNPQEDVIYDILCRLKKESNKSDINKLESINKNELLELLKTFEKSKLINLEDSKDLKKKIDQSGEKDIASISQNVINNVSKNSINSKKTEDSRKIQDNIESNIKKVMKNKDIKDIKKYVEGHINKNRGIKNEKEIINKYMKKNNTNITNNNSKLYKMKLFSLNEHNIYVCGKIDGIENDELIEIKNRRNRLFEFIPIYEQIQIEIYFRLTNLKTGKLIQNYNDTTSEFVIQNNDTLWDNILNELKIACKIIIEQL